MWTAFEGQCLTLAILVSPGEPDFGGVVGGVGDAQTRPPASGLRGALGAAAGSLSPRAPWSGGAWLLFC